MRLEIVIILACMGIVIAAVVGYNYLKLLTLLDGVNKLV
jgi:hypothetical protein